MTRKWPATPQLGTWGNMTSGSKADTYIADTKMGDNRGKDEDDWIPSLLL